MVCRSILSENTTIICKHLGEVANPIRMCIYAFSEKG